PSTKETCGLVAWKSKKPSGSISANRAPFHVFARYPPASDAPWPPSFQPRKAVIMTGSWSVGRCAMRSSSAIRQSYVRGGRSEWPDEEDRQRHGRCPDRPREEHVDEDDAPGQMCAPLDLADDHLEEQEHEHDDADGEETRGPLAAGGEVAEAEEQGREEDRDDD